MIRPFDIDVLLLPASAIFCVTSWISIFFVGNPLLCTSLALVKTGLFVIYYSLLFDGTYTFLDDWTYLKVGEILLNQGIGATGFSDLVFSLAGGQHIIYYLYNAYAFRLFGIGYYAPVALNVILTVFIAYLGASLANKEKLLDCSSSKVFYIFLILHPDVLAWSTVMNGKDTLVLFLHVLMLQGIAFLIRKNIIKFSVYGLLSCLLLLFLRFYVPFLFGFSFIVYNLFRLKLQNLMQGILQVGLTIIVILYLYGSGLEANLNTYFSYIIANIFQGITRFLLTPIPFNTEKAYAFLNIPSLIHWFLFPLLLIGLFRLKNMTNSFAKYLFWYMIIFILFYGTFFELQGPRHRFQLTYVVALAQFLGLIGLKRIQKYQAR